MQLSLSKDDPRAARLLELSKAERSPENRRELADILREVGVPEAALTAPVEFPAAGAASLSITELPGDVSCRYEVLGQQGHSEIMLIHGAVPRHLCQQFMAVADHVASWSQGGQVSGSGDPYVGSGRTSRNARVRRSENLFWARWEAMLERVMADAARLYCSWNRHCVTTKQEGWEVVRYEAGQRFDMHVDQVAGHPNWGQRQLSAILYLNDDYEAGATRFPRQALELKPAAGAIALFPPFWTHPHEASPPTKGAKYVVVGWFCP